jgi:superfamily II DNA helicase RecQ
LIQGLGLSIGKRGVIYVRSYGTGNKISEALQCPFYKARADHKCQVLQDWIEGPGGWIVATGALGTGINIEGIIYVVHIDRPYGLTSFIQQSGRGGRAGEISDSIIIVRVKNTSGRRRSEILSEYSVEQIDEDAMTEFIQSTQCRRVVLGSYLDVGEAADCQGMDGVFCDRCKAQRRTQVHKAVKVTAENIEETKDIIVKKEAESGSQAIARQLEGLVEADETMFQVMDRLKRQCLFCELIQGDSSQVHKYEKCAVAVGKQCGYVEFQEWRKTVQFGGSKHCWKCGLSQEMCRGLERGIGCEYPDMMMPGIYLLHQCEHLQGVAETAGFHGDYRKDFWEWMQEEGEGFGRVRESHWIGVWRQVCYMYLIMKGERPI